MLSRRTAWLVAIVATLTMTMTVSYIDRQTLSVLSVAVMESLHISKQGILAGSQSLALIIVSPLIGRLVDQLHSYDVPTLALGLWAVPGGAVWLAWRPALRYIPRARVHRAG